MNTRMAVSLLAVLGLVAATRAQPPDPTAAEPVIGASPVVSLPAETGPAPAEPVIGASPVVSLPAETGPAPDLDKGILADNSPGRWWVSGDYLLGWIRGGNVPPLVTTSPAGTPQAMAGVLGQPTTTILFGNSTVNTDLRSGFRLGTGGCLTSDGAWRCDIGFVMLESQATPFSAASGGTPILARPFVDARTNTPTSQLVAFPNVFTGSIAALDHSNNFYGGHADVEEVFLCTSCWRVASLLGYRFLRFDDGLDVDQNVTAQGGGILVRGTQIITADRFSAQNEFHGLDLGLRADYAHNGWSVGLLGKIAVGRIEREVSIGGSTQITVPGSGTTNLPGGFLALSSNSGTFKSEDWVVAPELGATLGWDINCNLRLSLGYSVLFWTDVARAANQVDLTINPNLFPNSGSSNTTPSRPAFVLQKSDLWVQSLNLGIEVRF
jgi:hypothetical protein